MVRNETNAKPVHHFETEQAAWSWLYETVDDPCIDNTRFAYVGDVEAEAKFEAQREDGCCGRADYIITVAGREAYIGCNYGH